VISSEGVAKHNVGNRRSLAKVLTQEAARSDHFQDLLAARSRGQSFLNLLEIPEDLILLLAREDLMRLVAEDTSTVCLARDAPPIQKQVHVRRLITFRVPLQVVLLSRPTKELAEG